MRGRSASSPGRARAFASGLRDLKPGDHVVHVDHGVGLFAGLRRIEVGGETHEVLDLRYAGDDKLYLPIERLDLIERYTGGARPTLDRLGGVTWERAKTRVRRAMRDMAEELLKLAGAETAALTVQADAPMQESIALLESRLQKLQAQVEAEQAAYRRFTQQRDLAWDALKALSTKQAELRLERAAANTEVRMGTPAIAPDEPVQIASAPISIALAAVVGFMLAIFLAFLLEHLGRPPLFVRTSQAV